MVGGVHNLEHPPVVRAHKQHVKQLTVSSLHLGVHGDLPVLAGVPVKGRLLASLSGTVLRDLYLFSKNTVNLYGPLIGISIFEKGFDFEEIFQSK